MESGFGTATLRVLHSDRVVPGTVFVPMHWTTQFSSAGRIGAVIKPDTDPVSGQPALKGTFARISAVAPKWFGFAVLRERSQAVPDGYWALATAPDGWRLELAGDTNPDDWPAYARALFGMEADQALLSFLDERSGHHRFAAFENDRLIGALFVGPEPVAASRNWAAGLLTADLSRPQDRLLTLAGRPAAGEVDEGSIICSCFSVGINRIAGAVSAGRAVTVDQVGDVLSAGSNCGSCRGEIQRIIDNARHRKTG